MANQVQLTPSMQSLLDWASGSDCDCVTVGYLSDELEYSRETVRRNLKELSAAGHAELVHKETALYRLGSDPRDA